ncbi:MAG: hypothetical protein LBQ55_00145 [Treponema sp.]|nr:hypothetical protein [Treponema sp.]
MAHGHDYVPRRDGDFDRFFKRKPAARPCPTATTAWCWSAKSSNPANRSPPTPKPWAAAACWQNESGGMGPWSDIVVVTVP